jgi:hypothetical protein
VNVRDERTVGEQIKSGFRLVGWILLTLAVVWALLVSIGAVLNKTAHPSLFVRAAGACGLVAISIVLFVSTQYWAKWFVGFLGLYAFKSAFALVLSPKSLYLQILLLLIPAFLLCARCVLNNISRNIEKLGFVMLVLTLGSTLVLDSTLPLLVGVTTFALIELAAYILGTKT